MIDNIKVSSSFCFVRHWKVESPENDEAVLRFWKREGAFANDSMATERLKELVLHARDGSGEVAGVCTVVPVIPLGFAQPLYYYRCFIGKPWRGSRLVARLLLQAFELLEAHSREHGFPCIGMLLELENTRFGQTLRAPVWGNPGFTYAGLSGRGLELRLRYFRGARLKRPLTAQE